MKNFFAKNLNFYWRTKHSAYSLCVWGVLILLLLLLGSAHFRKYVGYRCKSNYSSSANNSHHWIHPDTKCVHTMNIGFMTYDHQVTIDIVHRNTLNINIMVRKKEQQQDSQKSTLKSAVLRERRFSDKLFKSICLIVSNHSGYSNVNSCWKGISNRCSTNFILKFLSLFDSRTRSHWSFVIQFLFGLVCMPLQLRCLSLFLNFIASNLKWVRIKLPSLNS